MTTAIEINCETGEVIERPLTADEIATNEAAAAAFLEQKAEDEREATEKAALRDAVIAKLGLSADEVAALLA